jgi:peroxiredoxin
LRGFEQHLAEFEKRGVRVVAISVDPPEVNRRHTAKQGYTYTFLSDPKAEVIRRYDLLHPHASPSGGDIARPAEFLIDSSGTIRWVNLTQDWRIRARPEQVLKVIDDLHLASGQTSP